MDTQQQVSYRETESHGHPMIILEDDRGRELWLTAWKVAVCLARENQERMKQFLLDHE